MQGFLRSFIFYLRSVIQGEAAGKCPIVSNSTRCHIGLAHTCNNDVECPNGTYCCFDGCRRKCLDTEGNSAGAQGTDLYVELTMDDFFIKCFRHSIFYGNYDVRGVT